MRPKENVQPDHGLFSTINVEPCVCNSYENDGVLILPLRGEKAVFVPIKLFRLKCSQRELLRHFLGFERETNMAGDRGLF